MAVGPLPPAGRGPSQAFGLAWASFRIFLAFYIILSFLGSLKMNKVQINVISKTYLTYNDISLHISDFTLSDPAIAVEYFWNIPIFEVESPSLY